MIDALDGVRLQADLARVDGARGAAVVTHPHPLYGGDRFNPVVETMFRTLPDAGFTTVRFDFRGVNESGGTHDDGDAERLDVVAAIELLEIVEPDVPIWLVGYSFGSLVALNVVDPRLTGWVAIAPPLAARPGRVLAATDHRPKFVLSPERDQFSPPEATEPIIADWANTEFQPIAAADHFLAGRLGSVALSVVAYLGHLA